MNAYEKAEALVGAKNLRAYMDECARVGIVHIDSRFVLMGFRVASGWFIRLAVGRGSFARFVELMPYRLEFIGWAREFRGRKEVVWHPTDKVLRKVEQYERIRRNKDKEFALKIDGA